MKRLTVFASALTMALLAVSLSAGMLSALPRRLCARVKDRSKSSNSGGPYYHRACATSAAAP